MNNTLDDLFLGNLSPTDQQKFNKELMGKLCRSESELIELLNDKEKELFDSFVKTQLELNAETALENFKHGFKLGCCFIIEALK